MLPTLRAELTKTFTLRSIQVTLAAAIVVTPALAVASGLAVGPGSPQAAALTPTAQGFETAGFGQPLIVLLAALIMGSEYLDGQVRTTLLANPRRGRVLAVKFTVVMTLASVIGIVATSTAVVLKNIALGPSGLPLDRFTIGMGMNVLGVALNYALIALIAAAITLIARSFIVTLVVLVPIVLGISISLVGLIPPLRYLPDLAGIQLLTSYSGLGLLDPLPGALVMATWAAVAATVSALVFGARDTGGAG